MTDRSTCPAGRNIREDVDFIPKNVLSLAVDRVISVPIGNPIVHGAGLSTAVPVKIPEDGLIVWAKGSALATTQDLLVRAMTSLGFELIVNNGQLNLTTNGDSHQFASFANCFGPLGQEKLPIMREVTMQMVWQVLYQNVDAATDFTPLLMFGMISKARAIDLGLLSE